MPSLNNHAVLCAAAALALAAGPARAAQPFDTWGKADVSFEQYRDDAAARHGMGTAGASAAEDMYRMTQLAARSEQIRSGIRPEKRMRELQAALVSIAERCLVDRGYTRFRLTAEQQATLGRLKKGSPERHRFLHALASDPDVLASQRLSQG